jgi:hypothetical protein
MPKWKDIIGKTYGELTVIDHAPNRPRKDREGQFFKMWLCECVCGKRVEVETQNLKRNPSCGCKKREKISRAHKGNKYHLLRKTIAPPPSNRRHGHTAGGKTTPEFRAWTGMQTRCNNPCEGDAACYAGVTVCERWTGKEGFQNFLADMGPRPSPKHSIDRIEGAKGYGPVNCRWATKKEQSQNRKNVIWLTHNGKTQCAADWAKELGLGKDTVRVRYRKGLPVERILSPERVPHKDRQWKRRKETA